MVDQVPVQQAGDLTFPKVDLSLTNYKFDVDQPGGVQIRFTGDGMAVYMAFRHPGLFFNDHGKRVPDVIASAAGYPIDRLGKLRELEEAKRKFGEQMDREFAVSTANRIVWAEGDYRVVEVYDDLYNVEFVDGEDATVLNARAPLSLEVAKRRFEELTGTIVSSSASAEPSQPGDADVEKPASRKAK